MSALPVIEDVPTIEPVIANNNEISKKRKPKNQLLASDAPKLKSKKTKLQATYVQNDSAQVEKIIPVPLDLVTQLDSSVITPSVPVISVQVEPAKPKPTRKVKSEVLPIDGVKIPKKEPEQLQMWRSACVESVGNKGIIRKNTDDYAKVKELFDKKYKRVSVQEVKETPEAKEEVEVFLIPLVCAEETVDIM